MTKPIIYVDMDGVIANWVGRVLEVMGSPLKDHDIDTWDVEGKIGVTREQLWGKIQGAEFWENLDPYPWFRELWAAVEVHGRPVILSSPGPAPGAAAGKVAWLHKHLGPDFNDWVLTNRKHYVTKPGQILIDDSDRNCSQWDRHEGRSILFPQYWNSYAPIRRAAKFDPVDYVITMIAGTDE
jgi:5'(3')-deoxyribonucleotidase